MTSLLDSFFSLSEAKKIRWTLQELSKSFPWGLQENECSSFLLKLLSDSKIVSWGFLLLVISSKLQMLPFLLNMVHYFDDIDGKLGVLSLCLAFQRVHNLGVGQLRFLRSMFEIRRSLSWASWQLIDAQLLPDRFMVNRSTFILCVSILVYLC